MIEGKWTPEEVEIYRAARSTTQKAHSYNTRPHGLGFSAECKCGELLLAETRDSLDRQIANHVENKAEEAAVAAVLHHRRGTLE